MTAKEILSLLPYSEPFLFVDEITSVSENGITGCYTFREESEFYKGHFKDYPMTPGVLLIECMAQIGLVGLGIFLISDLSISQNQIAMSDTQMDFYLPVTPGEKVWVVSEKIYFRFNKLKCKVVMNNSKGEMICKGTISGMIITNKK